MGTLTTLPLPCRCFTTTSTTTRVFHYHRRGMTLWGQGIHVGGWSDDPGWDDVLDDVEIIIADAAEDAAGVLVRVYHKAA